MSNNVDKDRGHAPYQVVSFGSPVAGALPEGAPDRADPPAGEDGPKATARPETGGLPLPTAEPEGEKGIIAELGTLPPGAIVTEDGLARMFKRCTMSIKRAVERGELPYPVKMFGANTWTVGAVLRHVEGRLQQAAKVREAVLKKIS